MTKNCPTQESNKTTPDEYLDALADVLAEGIVYLGERGLLDFALAPISDLPDPQKSGNPDVPERP